jgi:hypothetical protein
MADPRYNIVENKRPLAPDLDPNDLLVHEAEYLSVLGRKMDMALCNDNTLADIDLAFGADENPRNRASVREISICVAVRSGPRMDISKPPRGPSTRTFSSVRYWPGCDSSRLLCRTALSPNRAASTSFVTCRWRAETSTVMFMKDLLILIKKSTRFQSERPAA